MSTHANAPSMLDEVATGLHRPQKELSPKFFYDQRGSELFERITALPEYYPTRTERALLERFAPGWIETVKPRSLVELGAGAAAKTRILLDAMDPVRPNPLYVPLDISAEFLEDAAETLRADYPAVQVRPVVADLSLGLPAMNGLPGPRVFAFLGGTIGNFQPQRAARLLASVASAMLDGDHLLLGVDLVKPVEILERAYNDAAGVTAAFNLNVLRVLNRELGTDFDPTGFRHHAFFAAERSRIEMHLVATRPMTVTLPGAGTIEFREGESIRTEISCKYERPSVARMFEAAGLALGDWVVKDPGFALATAVVG